MAFTGVAVVKQVTDGLIRITGLSLAGAAAGVIGLFGKTVAPDVRLPEAFKPEPYTGPEGQHVTLQDQIQCWMVPVTSVSTAIPIEVVKTGTTASDFALTLTNTTVATVSPQVEIYIRQH